MTFNLHRRALIGGLGAALAAPAILRAAQAAPPDYVEVETHEGRLRGSRENGVTVFRGVRYAAPPLGAAYRFKAPGKLQSWTGVRDALVFGPASIQAPNAGTRAAPRRTRTACSSISGRRPPGRTANAGP